MQTVPLSARSLAARLGDAFGRLAPDCEVLIVGYGGAEQQALRGLVDAGLQDLIDQYHYRRIYIAVGHANFQLPLRGENFSQAITPTAAGMLAWMHTVTYPARLHRAAQRLAEDLARARRVHDFSGVSGALARYEETITDANRDKDVVERQAFQDDPKTILATLAQLRGEFKASSSLPD